MGLIPSGLTDVQAATLGTGVITAGVALFKTLGLPLSRLTQASAQHNAASEKDGRPWFLVWGGAGITGIYLIQLAKLAGYRVICAASPVNEAYIKSLGADVVLNRWDAPEDVVAGIRAATGDAVALAVDNVGKETATLCERVLAGSKSWREANGVAIDSESSGESSEAARLVAIAGSPAPRTPALEADSLRAVSQPRISFSTTFYGHPDFSVPLLDAISSLLASGALKPARTHVLEGGLGRIVDGLQDLKKGRVPGGHKLVCQLGELEGDAGQTREEAEEVQEIVEEVVEKAEKRGELAQSIGKRTRSVEAAGAKRVKSAHA